MRSKAHKERMLADIEVRRPARHSSNRFGSYAQPPGGCVARLDRGHTSRSEGSELGPTLSFHGIDNSTFYTLAADKRYYKDYSGTGSSVRQTLRNDVKPVVSPVIATAR